jgi:hypothetical protein
MRLVVVLAVVLLPGLMLAPVWHLAGLGAGEDDILYYFPARTFFHETIQAGQWPWLNPWTGLGRPFAADPQTAFWYPFTWLFALLPPLLAYPASLWLHYSLALWGMYRLLRLTPLSRTAALFGGIAFAFCGFMLAHRAHFTMQHAAAWAPWVLWALVRYARTPDTEAGRHASTQRLVTAAVVLALQCFAGHIQIAALTVAGALIWLLARGSATPTSPERKRRARRPRTRGGGVSVWRAFSGWLIACICAAGLFAVQWLPTFDYLRLCTRVQRTYRDFVENSWHPTSAVDWLLPMLYGQRTPNFFDQPYWGTSHQVEQFAYAGILPLLLALLALRSGWRHDPRRRPWIVLGALGLLLALGQYGPLCPLLYWVPGSSLFRCPARALLLVNLAIAALAAVSLHDLGVALGKKRTRLRGLVTRWTARPFTVAFALVGVPLILVLIALPFLSAEPRAAALRVLRPWNPAIWVPLLTAVVSLGALAAVVRRGQRPHALGWLVVVSALDLAVIGWTIDVPAGPRNPEQLITPQQPAEWMEPVAQSSERLWVVTGRAHGNPGEYVQPVEKAVANTNMLRDIASLTDYGPLNPRAIAARFGFEPWGETRDAERLLADTAWMRLYNVGWVLLCDDYWPAPAGCDLAATTPEGWRLYRQSSAAGWTFFEDPAQPGAVHGVRSGPVALTIHVDSWPTKARAEGQTHPAGTAESGPRVIVSALHLPGWTARVNGRPVPLDVVDTCLLGVRVPPGTPADIQLAYFPPGLMAGAVISLACTAVLAVFLIGSLRRGPAGSTAAARRRGRPVRRRPA